jgi:hypothetical protein
MNKSKNIVLGGGIAGLIYSFYNPDTILISENIGGQFVAPFQLGPRLIHQDCYTERLLVDLNLYFSTKIKTVNVGYFYDGKLTNKNTEKNKREYFKRTRLSSSVPYSSVMSSGKNKYHVYDISEDVLIQTLLVNSKSNFVIDSIEKIDLYDHKVHTKKQNIFEYENLISTIPANIFYKLSNLPQIANLFTSLPTTFRYSEKLEDNFPDFPDYDYVYVTDLKYSFHRITRVENGYVYEINDNLTSGENTLILKTGQLIQNVFNISVPNVEFIGRYAKWDHSIKINEVLKQVWNSNRF